MSTTTNNPAAVGPTVDDLKAKFSERTIPLESDFVNLINMADHGRRAVGLSPEQTPNAASGLVLDGEDRLTVLPGTGIMVSPTGVSIENSQLLVAGMIMMFSGMDAPVGWAFCDGTNGRPDLRNRFILGGSPAECGNPNAPMQQLTPLNNKAYFPAVSQVTPTITMNNASTVLTEAMMPRHYHNGGLRLDNWAYNWATEISEYGVTNVGNKGCVAHVTTPHMDAATSNTSWAGGNASHSHANTATQNAHSHTVNVIPPYYILAFIIKL